jgi:hypothetical protein
VWFILVGFWVAHLVGVGSKYMDLLFEFSRFQKIKKISSNFYFKKSIKISSNFYFKKSIKIFKEFFSIV